MADVEFFGSERFSLLSRLGAGGSGVVYAAFDRTKQQRVALKTLKTPTSSRISRFHEEFHSHKDLLHPNLVALFELLQEHERWFFTMELVEGVDFLRYVRPLKSARWDESRLRSALAQLARGIAAIHAAGKVHRDIKPSNSLVTPHRIQVWYRGTKFREQKESQIARAELARLDACWTAASGLLFQDLTCGFDLFTRHLLLALDMGEPYRVSRALSAEVLFASLKGAKAGERVSALVQKSTMLAEETSGSRDRVPCSASSSRRRIA